MCNAELKRDLNWSQSNYLGPHYVCNKCMSAWGANHRLLIRQRAIAVLGGKCAICGEPKPDFLTFGHLKHDGVRWRLAHNASAQTASTWIAKHPARAKGVFQLECFNCNYSKEYRNTNADYHAVPRYIDGKVNPEYQKRLNVYWRNIFFDHYGAKCSCCGDADITHLTVGHPNSDGLAHRRLEKAGGARLYRKISRNGYRAQFEIEVQCWNCNCGSLRTNGTCPHKP